MKRIFVLFLTALILFALCGCAAILEDEVYYTTAHPGSTASPSPDNGIEASDYESLKSAIFGFVKSHETSGLISIYTYEGDIDADVQKACAEIMEVEPIGVYALDSLDGVTTKIVSYYEVEIEAAFKRTKAQMDSIITISTLRYLRSEILNFISSYASEAVISTNISITQESVSELVRELYYENPLSVVMLPSTVVKVFPPEGINRIIELTFENWIAADHLQAYKESLERAVAIMVMQASGENDMEILRDLCDMLMSACEYDADGAVLIAEYGTQNSASTAYGALVTGSAVGEGYAMAYKALCDELGIECTVVLGKRGDMLHAWNIVALDGNYYHVDAAACDEDGFIAGFLKSDEQLEEAGYVWDREAAKVCGGPFSIIPEVEPPVEANGEQPVNPIDGENTGEETTGDPGENPPEDGTGDEPTIPDGNAEQTE